MPAMLLTKGLHVNGSKTEKYHIQRSGEDAWKKCKCLGSLLDTDEDIKREKGLIIDSYKTFESIFSGKHVSEKVKIRVFADLIKYTVETCFKCSWKFINKKQWNFVKN